MKIAPVRWELPADRADDAAIEALREGAGLSALASRILHARGVRTPEAARAFLQPRLDALLDPNGITGMDVAVRRIREAAAKGEPIWVYGDYDVDGSSATALLVNFFRAANLPIRAYIPHRMNEGYGLNAEALKTIAAEGGKVVITVDNGIAAFKEALAARALGIDLIITDHHEPQGRLPEAFAVLNPRQPGCGYPEKGLAGVGLAFKLAWAVAQGMSQQKKVSPVLREFLLDAMGLVALGTVSDMAPLLGENRVLVRYGLSALSTSRHPGIAALRGFCRLEGGAVQTRDIGFGMGPRINAGGRIGMPDLGLRLLTAATEEEAAGVAKILEQQNRDRQKIERRITESALAQVAGAGGRRTYVLGDPDWHVGVVGIVASRIVDRTHRPAIVIAWSPDGTGKGSGRSIRNFHLVEALTDCSEHLVTFGGHARAAGVTVERGRFEAFRDRFERSAEERLSEADLEPAVTIDAPVLLSEVTEKSAGELSMLAPFGIGNPEPVLAAFGVEAVGSRRRVWGARAQVFLRQGEAVRAAFGPAEWVEPVAAGAKLDAAFTIRLSRRGEAELELKALRPAREGAAA